MKPSEMSAPEKGSRASMALRVALALAAIGALVWLGRRAGDQVPRFAAWVDSLGFWAPAAFFAGYVLATVAFVPGSLLTLAAGAVFGLWKGTALVFAAATVGASAAFLIARYAARGAIERRVASDPRFAAIDRAVGAQGRRVVFLLRLSPVFPFNLLNYALGLTRVRFVDFFVASIGMLPGTFLYVYLGKGLGSLATLGSGRPVATGAGGTALLVLGLLATVLVTGLVTRAARRALAEVEDDRPSPGDAVR